MIPVLVFHVWPEQLRSNGRWENVASLRFEELLFAGAAVLCAGLAIGSGQLPLPATKARVAVFRAALREPLMSADGWEQQPGPPPFLRSTLDSRTPRVAFIGDSAMAQYATTILSRSRASPSRPLVSTPHQAAR